MSYFQYSDGAHSLGESKVMKCTFSTLMSVCSSILASTAFIIYLLIRIVLCYTLLGNALLLNFDVESVTNVHLSTENVSLLSTAHFSSICVSVSGTCIDQLLDSLQAMQACYMVFCHGGSHIGSTIFEVSIFGTWAAYQDVAWQVLPSWNLHHTKISNSKYSQM